ncbi:MAG TPA: methyltransferase domain-containing protein [Syntrophorhabdaceae bacterium]|nr:methyltransferase domain-containing protein [Syntrophorhabdaceae bacterium]
MLGLNYYTDGSIYIDVAGADSPWAKLIRDIYDGRIISYSIDIKPSKRFSKYDFYVKMDATKTNFNNNSIDGVSLQCAFEMFIGNDDIALIKELKRILKPLGKAVILPLYMHTHSCHYASPDFYGKGLGDKDSIEYIRWDCYGIPSSRKYSAQKLKARILDLITDLGLKYKIYVLRNKEEISEEIYLHFILEIEK